MIAPVVVMCIAASAMLAFVSVRRTEVARGERFFEAERALLDARVSELWTRAVRGGVPMSWRSFLRAVLHDATHLTVHAAVEGIRAVERPLARLSYKMRISAPKSGVAPVSEFLKVLTPDKK